MESVTILSLMYFGYNTKNQVPLNQLQYKMVIRANWIGYNIGYKVLAFGADGHIGYNTS